jgi:three-Cys-motif partner protein
MAGEPTNRERETGEEFDGSARLAMSSNPGFTRLAFCEFESKAKLLDADLRAKYPGRSFRVYPGDCNQTIDQVLRDLAPFSWAPTFVFVDQQAAEVGWQTLAKAAKFRTGSRKSELWILASPTMITKGVSGTNGRAFIDRVDQLYGSDDWRRIQAARTSDSLTAEEYRDEMVNLLRWQLENTLGYKQTARIPMNMPTGVPIYDMVFATDHEVGQKIMTHLYRKAAEREPAMVAEAKLLARKKREEKSGVFALFDMEQQAAKRVDDVQWRHTSSWNPAGQDWW